MLSLVTLCSLWNRVLPQISCINMIYVFSFSMLLEYVDERGSHHWSEERFKNVIRLRQEALDKARAMNVDYLMVNVLSLHPYIPPSLLPSLPTPRTSYLPHSLIHIFLPSFPSPSFSIITLSLPSPLPSFLCPSSSFLRIPSLRLSLPSFPSSFLPLFAANYESLQYFLSIK